MANAARPPSRRTERRVQEIARLMARGRYVTGVTPTQLAEKWGLKPQTVANLACEASRRIRAEIQDSGELRALIIASLQHIVATCLKTKKAGGKDRPDLAIKALAVMAGVAAIEAKGAPALEEAPRFIVEVSEPVRPPAPELPALPSPKEPTS